MKHSKKIIVLVAVLIAVAALFCGTKHFLNFQKGQDLVVYANYKMSRPAFPLPKEVKDPRELEFSRVSIAGSYLYKHEFLVKMQDKEGKNTYQVFVPFKRASGQMVLVDRGLISEDKMGDIVRPKGLLKIEGIVTLPWIAAGLKNDPEKDNWYWPDMDAMAKKAKVNKFIPVIIKSVEDNSYPVTDKIRVESGFYNIGYATIYYAFALLVLSLTLVYNKKYR